MLLLRCPMYKEWARNAEASGPRRAAVIAACIGLLLCGAVAVPSQPNILQVGLEAEGQAAIPRAGSLSLRGTVKDNGTSAIQGLERYTSSLTGWTVKTVPESIDCSAPGNKNTSSSRS